MRRVSQWSMSRPRVQLDGSWITRAGTAPGSSVAETSSPLADAVVVAYVHANDVAYSWHHSIVELLGNDIQDKQRVWRAGYISMSHGTDGLADARNRAVVEFLRDNKAPWLLWIDTDMGFPPDVIEQLMAAADPVERPIVGGLAFTWRQGEPDGMGGWDCIATPTTFDWGHEGDAKGFVVNYDYAFDKVQQVAGTGSACVLIHRSVFEDILKEFKPKGQLWYDRVPNPAMGKVLGEDLSFCLRANAVGKTVWVDTGVKTTHKKTIWVSEVTYIRQRMLDDLMSRAPQVPPATEPTAIIVPVLGRPQNAEPFMESLKASGAEMANVYPVIDESEDPEVIKAWADAGAGIVIQFRPGHPGTFAEKVNAAYRNTNEPWLFLVGDDVRFQPGWLDHAQHAARDGAHVIGTNDLHNPRVTSGEHATHLLIRRNYIDERGASWDGPKVVCHEGYRHNFVDNEIVTVAKQRGVWEFAQHSKVEHLHPVWGNAETDSTYERGAASVLQDKELFEQRLAENG